MCAVVDLLAEEAAAPDLLAACRAALETVREFPEPALTTLLAAIARAEGRDQ